MTENAVETATEFQRFVLLAVADLSTPEAEPVHSYEVKRACERHAETIDADLFGGVTRREVINALSALAETELLEEATTTSPVGKGRPAYALSIDAEDVFDALADDDRFGSLVARIR